MYRVYVTDGLRMIARNTAGIIPMGTYPEKRYHEILHPAPEETRTPEEVKNYMLQRLKEG